MRTAKCPDCGQPRIVLRAYTKRPTIFRDHRKKVDGPACPGSRKPVPQGVEVVDVPLVSPRRR